MPDLILYLEDVIKVAREPLLFNEKAVEANFEYKIRIGNVKKITLKARGGTFKIAFNQGQSSVSFIQLADGISYNEDLVDTREDFMIYFQSSTAGAILEIIAWR